MTDLGSELGEKVLDSILNGNGEVFTKLIDAITKLVDKIYDTHRDLWERGLKQQLNDSTEKKNVLKSFNGKINFVKYSSMKKEQGYLSIIGIHMNKKEMKDFIEVIKREGIVITTLVDKENFKKNNRCYYEVLCQNKDLQSVINIINRLNDEKKIESINNKIEKIMTKGEENLSEQDKIDIKALNKEKQIIQEKYCTSLNEQQLKAIIDESFNKNDLNKISFNEVMNRNTGRGLDIGSNTIIADAKNPERYIICSGYKDIYKGKTYIKTNYEVFRDGKKVFTTNDGRFENRPIGYWENQKKMMKDTGGLSNTLFKFYSVEDYKSWAKEVRNKNEIELSQFEKNKDDKDYGKLIKSLEKQLNERGASFKDGIVIDKKSKNTIGLEKDISPEKQIKNAETIIIGKQIKTYKEISRLESELGIARSNVITTEKGTVERERAEKTFKEVNTKYMNEIEKEKSLIEKRKVINAVKANIENKNEKVFKKDLHKIKNNKSKKMNIKEIRIKVQEERNKKFNIKSNTNIKQKTTKFK